MSNGDEQLELVSTVESMDGRPVSLGGLASQYSGRYIRERNPKLAALIVLAVGTWGLPACQVSKATGVHEAAIAEIVRGSQSELSLEEDKRVILSGLRQLRRSALVWLQDQFDAGRVTMDHFQQVVIALGIVTEKHELLSGGATHRVERMLSAEEEQLRAFFMGQAAGSVAGMGKVFGAESLGANADEGSAPALRSESGRITTGPVIDAQTGDSLTPDIEAGGLDNA